MDKPITQLLKPKEAAKRLGHGETTVRALMKSGELEVVCITEDARITDRSIDALIERRTRPARKPVEPEPPKHGRGRPRKHPQRGPEPSGGAKTCAEAYAITS